MTTRSQSFLKFCGRNTLVIIHVSVEASICIISFATSGICSKNELPGFFPPATEKKKERKR